MKSCGISIVFEDDEDISGKHNEEDPEESKEACGAQEKGFGVQY